ncbi:hypothetical protein B0H16DRAFT_1783026 [Mycena metata]|uniref:Protein kinase domain-containing protein n=1 Tax=Mycena metata TaxID=1033252 RepID=A0AAD7KFH0_9AGAR|nr:hypothetical protein B0H16DRAFT_1783026 [Mycena metata]
MPFISNADNFTLGEGTYINVQGNYHVHTHNLTKRREEIEGTSPRSNMVELSRLRGSHSSDEEEDGLLLTDRPNKRRRLEAGAASGLEIIQPKDLQLIRQIGGGPGYLLHAGRNKARAVTVKVFNGGPTVREQLEATVALCGELMHPNILRIEGISSPTSSIHFIAYEDVRWKSAKGPLAAALQNRTRSIRLGFKMVADLSAGLNYLCTQGISLTALRVQNLDVFLDMDDRFLIIINPNSSDEADGNSQPVRSQEDRSWALFNELCHKLLVSANRVLHNEEIDREPVLLPPSSPASQKSDSFSLSSYSQTEQEDAGEDVMAGDPRREYVWRAMDRGNRCLATVSDQMTLNLDIALPVGRLQRLTQTDGRRAHRCRGYIREEVTLAPTIVNSAVVAHDTPRPREICSICHEVVEHLEHFCCVCDDPAPGSRYTIRCNICKYWSHDDCVGNPQTIFTCRTHAYAVSLASDERTVPDPDFNSPLFDKFWILTEEDKEKRRCDSPTPIIRMAICHGFGLPDDATPRMAEQDETNVVKVDVASLASYVDSETTDGDTNGKNMTTALEEILRLESRDPKQPAKDVLVNIGQAMHTKAIIQHTAASGAKSKAPGPPASPPIDMFSLWKRKLLGSSIF